MLNQLLDPEFKAELLGITSSWSEEKLLPRLLTCN